MTTLQNGFEQTIAFLQSKQARVNQAKLRQAAVYRGDKPDHWPILFGLDPTPEQNSWLPDANFMEAFNDSDLMLSQELKGCLCAVNSNSDKVPSIRANMGCGNAISLFGITQEVYPDKMPWLQRHFSKAEISKLTPADIRIGGDFELGLKHIRHFKQVCGDAVPICCMDTQGPFDLAHLMLGNDLFLEVYDDPPFVHHLMELCMVMYEVATDTVKALAGEPANHMYFRNNIYSESFGIRICHDTTSIVGPGIIEEFAVPYTIRLAKRYGGAFVHYCGRNDSLTKSICNIPEVIAINFGHVPGHDHDHIFEADMELCASTGTIYFGSWPRRPGEPIKTYLSRLHSFAARGCLVPVIDPPSPADAAKLLDYWYAL